MAEKLRLGIIGAGWMADMACEEIVKTDNVELAGVCARRAERAEAFSKKYDIPFFCAGAEELLQRPEIEAVYIATLNDTHCEMARQAIMAGKAVILEKPFTLNAAQAEELIALAKERGVFLMEAMWTRFFPSFEYIALLVRSGAIGELKSMKVNMSLVMDREANARVFMREHGGGVLVDIGVYAVNFVQMLKNEMPSSVTNELGFAGTEVDMTDHIIFRYADGACAEINVSGVEDLPPVAEIEGSEGTIRFEGGLMSGRFTLERGGETTYFNMGNERFRYPYYFQFEHFARCVREGRSESDRMPLSDTLTVMRMMDEARAAGGFSYPQDEAAG